MPARMTQIALTAALGLIGGYCDVICFVRSGVFAATMTGNLVFVGRSLLFFFVECPKTEADSAHRRQMHTDNNFPCRKLCVQSTGEEVVFRFMVIFSHLLGVFAFVVLQRLVGPRRAVPLAAPGLALLVLLADLLPAALWYSGVGATSTSIAKQWSVCLVSLALGATHYAASPVSDESFLAAPAFAATVCTAHARTRTWCQRTPPPSVRALAGRDAQIGEDVGTTFVQPSRGWGAGEGEDMPGLLHGDNDARWGSTGHHLPLPQPVCVGL